MRTRSDSDEFAAFFRLEYPPIRHEITLILGDGDRAEEVAQEAFARAFARWRRVGRYERPGAWVRRVAIRLAMRIRSRSLPDAIRAHDRRRANQQDEHPDLDLRAAIAELPAAQRAAVVLHYLRDRPTAEVADALGCREATARVHLHRARKALAAVLESEGASREC